MKSGETLIVCITNYGHANELMSEARKAGARGGTIINARGTGTEKDASFFGISLVSEKEMLLIVAENVLCPSILSVINEAPMLAEPGSGIVFTIAVEQFSALGKLNF